jgi:hypothetical protein
MKRGTAVAGIAVFVFCLAASIAAAGEEDDLQVIKKAVECSHHGDHGKPAEWFRILITDDKSGGDVVKVTLPISLRKILTHVSKDGHHHPCHGDHQKSEAIKCLEELLPLTLLEIIDDGTKVKVWLE